MSFTMRASSIVPCNPLLAKERYSNDVALKRSPGRGPLMLLALALRSLRAEHLPIPGGMLPLNWLYPRSRTAKDGELLQKEEGMCPVKLLLLALIATRFLIFSHVMDGNSPVNRLLEIFSTCSGLSDTDGFNSCRSPLRRLKLTSRTTMLPEDISSAGRPPDRELYDRLRRDKLVSSPSDGAICPSRPLEVRRTSMTAPSSLQVMPSHTQQFVPFCHDMAMPPSCDSSARNWRRELFSCSTQAMAEVATMRSSSNNAAVARPEYGIASLLLHGECGVICMNSLIPASVWS
ncbi:hypothetical protein DAI22_02g045001 [Oryza sativa Japonica Group]|nr:hypothetical protein DAI22_02g045001 [Oryza sativa Japonica Group]